MPNNIGIAAIIFFIDVDRRHDVSFIFHVSGSQYEIQFKQQIYLYRPGIDAGAGHTGLF